MLKQLLTATAERGDWAILREAVRKGGTVHLAVMTEPFLSYILDGKKTIESRFSKNAVAPFGRVSAGELVLLKGAGGPVVGCFLAKDAEFIRLNAVELTRFKKHYSEALCADDVFWEERRDKRYATLIGVQGVRRLSPARVVKSDRRGWVVLSPSA
jgi:hypothetical protein